MHSKWSRSLAGLENSALAEWPVTWMSPIVTVGPKVSTPNDRSSAGPVLPATSTARTRMVCDPSPSPVNCSGLVQAA